MKTNNTKPKTQVKATIEESKLTRMPLIAGAAFAIITWALLNIFEHEFLYRVQELSLWLPTKVYFDERMMVPGGLMTYIACFLTQFFYYPMLGSLIYVALLIATQLLTQKVFAIPNSWTLLALIPSALILCCSMEVGYWIFQIKTQGYFYSMLVGFLFTLLAIRLYQVTKGWGRYVTVALIAAAGYPLFGFYALLALLTIIAFELASKERNIGLVLLCLAAGIATPILYYNVYEQTRFVRMFVAGMPAFQFIKRDLGTWVPYILLYLFPLVIPFIRFQCAKGHIQTKTRFITTQAIAIAVMVFVVQLFWFRDPNFRAEIKMNHAMERLEWRKVLDIAKSQEQTPTRLMVLNRNLALLKLGKAGDEMFHYLDGGEAPASPFEIRLMQVGGKMLYYHYARMNFCYRWCLEDAVEYGWKVDYIKYMVKTSIISGEYPLAMKYINTLKKTLFYKGWAEKYEKMIQSPELIAKDREFASILPLYQFENQLDGDNTLVEIYLLNYFAHTYNELNTPMFDEASLMCALTLKDIPTFWNCFFRYANSHKTSRMPTHYQEAALLYGNLEKNVDISKMPFDKSVKMRFQDFMRFSQKHAVKNVERDPEAKKLFYDRFGDTFWYFYFFIRDVKSY
ncbi:MAG: hypothetical protein IJZ31_05585 [Bacteroidaceae bacterium]|nr:hypothetical protein [Bacteroidaceae bacterium]